MDAWVLLVAAVVRLADAIIHFLGRYCKKGKKPPPRGNDE